MVEGPLVHRIAEIHRHLLLGKTYAATSPSGRFAEGASAISGRYLSLIEVHGKNIFYFFTRHKLEKALLANLPDNVVVVRIHFGMMGYFRTFCFPGPEPKVKTRLMLQSEDETVDAHLTASVCVHGDLELYRKTIAKLGPDPLRADADKELLWGKMQITRKTVGRVLMDQSLVAGIGNVYRSEILFACGLHPDQRASTLSRSDFEELWERSKRLLLLGLVTGSLATVYPKDMGQPNHQDFITDATYYAYGQSICKVCGGAVRTWPCAGRKVYACEVCQPLRKTSRGIVVDTLVEDVLIGEQETIQPQSGSIPHEDNFYPEVSDNRGTRASSFSQETRAESMTDFRTRRVAADKIAEHHPFMKISREGPWNNHSILPDLDSTCSDFSALQIGPLRTSNSERAGLPRKHHSQASQFGQVVRESISRSLCQTFTNQLFPARRVGYIALRALAAAKPQTRIGLHAVSLGCLGSSSPVLMLSARLSNALLC